MTITPEKSQPCRHCRKSIPEGAAVCYHCGRSQGFAANLQSGAPLITVVSLVLSIVLVILSWLQFNAATKQWTAADKASAEARDAKQSAEQARDEARKTIDLLRTNVRFMLERDYLTPKLLLTPSDIKGAERVSRKLEEFAVPDERERREWLESLKQRTAR